MATFMVVGVKGRVIYRHAGLDKGTTKKIASVIDKHLAKHGDKSYAQHGG